LYGKGEPKERADGMAYTCSVSAISHLDRRIGLRIMHLHTGRTYYVNRETGKEEQFPLGSKREFCPMVMGDCGACPEKPLSFR
jgi:hypothetical protein